MNGFYILGKLTLMKSYLPGFWYGEEMSISNLNIFRTTLSISAMKLLTNSKHCFGMEVPPRELYLGWNNMKWDTFGSIQVYNEPKKDMCRAFENITNILLTGIFKGLKSKRRYWSYTGSHNMRL